MARIDEPIDHPWLLSANIPVIISAGSFTKRKGFSDLLLAVTMVSKTRPVRLILLGDGYLRKTLTRQVASLGIGSIVDMPGFVSNTLQYFSRSSVFVLSSYSEGLPNVLVEAMICGCTPVATDCPTGPREVLGDGAYGYLVPMHDPVAMAKGILQALDKPINQASLDIAVEPFTESNVVKRHFEVLDL